MLAVLRSLATTYVGAQRAGDELRTRLVAIERQRAKLLVQTQEREYGSTSDRELADVERVRRTLARSASASAEHVRALEAVISAVAIDGVAIFDRAPALPAESESGAGLLAPTRPEAGVRGGWSPPPPDDDRAARRRLQ